MSHSHQEPQEYTAYLTSCKRDVMLTVPKCLIIDIRDSSGTLFRDHHYVPLLNQLDKIQPKNGNNKKVAISFTATESTYQSSEGPKQGLKNLKNIQLIKGLKDDTGTRTSNRRSNIHSKAICK